MGQTSAGMDGLVGACHDPVLLALRLIILLLAACPSVRSGMADDKRRGHGYGLCLLLLVQAPPPGWVRAVAHSEPRSDDVIPNRRQRRGRGLRSNLDPGLCCGER